MSQAPIIRDVSADNGHGHAASAPGQTNSTTPTTNMTPPSNASNAVSHRGNGRTFGGCVPGARNWSTRRTPRTAGTTT
jgi:hypothetical protein